MWNTHCHCSAAVVLSVHGSRLKPNCAGAAAYPPDADYQYTLYACYTPIQALRHLFASCLAFTEKYLLAGQIKATDKQSQHQPVKVNAC